MKHPLNILPVLALAAAALTVLPACKAKPKSEPAPEPAPQVAEAPAEKSYSWFAKKGQRRGEKVEAAAPVAAPAPAEPGTPDPLFYSSLTVSASALRALCHAPGAAFAAG